MTKLREEDLVRTQVLTAERGRSVRSTAQELGSPRARFATGSSLGAEGGDGRRHKPRRCAGQPPAT